MKDKAGAELLIFDGLEDGFPDPEETDQRAEAMTHLIAIKPKAG